MASNRNILPMVRRRPVAAFVLACAVIGPSVAGSAEQTSGEPPSDHWAYRAIRRLEPPAVESAAWCRNPIDRFILARLEAADVSPSAEADRYTLIRRVYYDLIGLPPTPEEVDAFVEDSSLDAYERLVDRLLASPHFGERWGRHWLDKARYADSDGYEKDRPRPDAWRYRDWVINAINDDLPFDQFTVEQLAGDLLPDATESQRLATAFHRQTLTNTEGGVDQEEFRVAAVVDRVNTTGTVWLGLTVGCAQCHTHKYDQITHAEYYQLFAFFNNAEEATMKVSLGAEAEAEYQKKLAEHRARLEALQAKVDPIASDDPSRKELEDRLAKLKKNAPQPPVEDVRVIGVRRRDRRATRVLRRGDFLQPTNEVQPGTPAVLPELEALAESGPRDRLDLARWLVSAENPLMARVAVNHVWSHLFGRGLVATPDDFGVRGEPPTHPELLDWLAREYMRLGWSRKAMIRTIVLSATYRQSSHHRPELTELDPLNELLHRQNRLRVEAEIIRDLHLAASGLLCRKIGGPSVFPPMPPDVAALSYANNFKWTTSEGGDRYRRGMYTFFKRTAPHPNLMTFDCPDSNVTTVERRISNTPLMALTTLNNEVFVDAARALGRRVLLSDATSEAERLKRLLRLCLSRPPSAAEVLQFLRLLEENRTWYRSHADDAALLAGSDTPPHVSPAETAAWTATARIALNLDEFITRE